MTLSFHALHTAKRAGTLAQWLREMTSLERIEAAHICAANDARQRGAEAWMLILHELMEDGYAPIAVPVAALADATTAAEQATDDPRWLRAIDAAYTWLLEQDTVLYNHATHALRVESATRPGRVYEVNGACQCEAAARGNPCFHRAAARLLRRALEIEAQWAERMAA